MTVFLFYPSILGTCRWHCRGAVLGGGGGVRASLSDRAGPLVFGARDALDFGVGLGGALTVSSGISRGSRGGSPGRNEASFPFARTWPQERMRTHLPSVG